MFDPIEQQERLIPQQQPQQWKEQDKDILLQEEMHIQEDLIADHLQEHKEEEIHQEEQEILKELWLQVKWQWKEHVKEIPQEDLKVEETHLVEHLLEHKQEEIHQEEQEILPED